MNILFITSSFVKKGSASIRNISIVNGLINNGAKVDVLTQDWPNSMTDDYLLSAVDKNVSIFFDRIASIDKYFGKSNDEQTNGFNTIKKKIFNIVNIKFIRRQLKSLIYFPDIDMKWVKTYNKKLKFSKYDLIISSSDTKTSHFVANDIRNRYPNIEWFQIWGDPWFDDKGTVGFQKIRAYFNEKKILQRADKAFYVSSPTCDAMKKKYKESKEKMHFLPRTFLKRIDSNRVRVVESEILFLYTGSIYYGRNIDALLKSISKFNKEHEIKIKLKIFGIYNQEAEKLLLSYDYVDLNGHINYGQVIEEMKAADVLVYLGNSRDTHQIPGKIYDYFGTNKIILALVEDINNPVSNFIKSTERCYIYQNSEKHINLNEINYNQNHLRALDEFSGDVQAKKLLNYLRGSE